MMNRWKWGDWNQRKVKLLFTAWANLAIIYRAPIVVFFGAHIYTFAMIPIKVHLTKQAILVLSDCFATTGARVLPFRWTRVAMHITTQQKQRREKRQTWKFCGPSCQLSWTAAWERHQWHKIWFEGSLTVSTVTLNSTGLKDVIWDTWAAQNNRTPQTVITCAIFYDDMRYWNTFGEVDVREWGGGGLESHPRLTTGVLYKGADHNNETYTRVYTISSSKRF